MKNINECLKIYCEAFGNDEPEFTDLLFKNCFEDCVLSEYKNSVASMFFALPCEIITETKKIPSIYIYAAATAQNFRGQGFMTKLLEDYKRTLPENTVLFLRPANNGLINFYKNCGFEVIKAQNDNSAFPLVKPINSFAKITKDITNGNGEEFTLMYYSKTPENINNLHFIYSME